MVQQLTLDQFIKRRKRKVSDKKVDKAIREIVNSNSSLLKEAEEKIPLTDKLEAKIIEPKNTGPCYLLSVGYDGKRQKAYLKLYDPKIHEIYFWYDNTGHLPYFLTDVPPDKINEIDKIIKHPAFDHVETVEKYDLLNDKKVVMTKIVMKDPKSVGTAREYVPKAWEAHIKYHNNYIYDRQLIPGMLYKIENGNLKYVKIKIPRKLIRKVKTILEEDSEFSKYAEDWLPLFQLSPPQLKRVAVDIEVYTPSRNRIPDPSQAKEEIISIAFVSNDGLRKVLLLAREGHGFGSKSPDFPEDVEIEVFDSERQLLAEAFRIMNSYPILLTFNGDNFDLPYLYHRAKRLGFNDKYIPIVLTEEEARLKRGIHIDLYRFFNNKAIQVYAFGNKYKEFTLDAIASALLGYSKVTIEVVVSDLTLNELLSYNFRDAQLTLNLTTFDDNLVMKLIILFMRISRLSINELTRHAISHWIKNLLYWEHRKRGYLIPLAEDIIAIKGEAVTSAIIKGKKYAGAIVVKPPEGVFFNVLVMDFASLYPSIIKKWNLSYETVNCPHRECKDNKIPETKHWVCKKRKGITALITGLLRDFRVNIYKKAAKDKRLSSSERAWYDVVQKAMKVFINASYGVFGASSFPLYCPPAAESVTAIGRYAIKNTISKAQELGLKVLYGDTDSLFLYNPPEDKIKKLEEWVEEELELEIEVDKIYRYVAFSGRKKNYIGIYNDGTVDVKGLVGKKRNTPEFVKKAFYHVLEALGKVNSLEEFEKVKETIREIIQKSYNRLKNRELTLDELAFKVSLSKPVEAYVKTVPQHVRAAKMLREVGVKIKKGDVITYVKIRSKHGVKPIQLAKLNEIDVDKYVEHIENTFEQLLSALNIEFKEIIGLTKLESFFT